MKISLNCDPSIVEKSVRNRLESGSNAAITFLFFTQQEKTARCKLRIMVTHISEEKSHEL